MRILPLKELTSKEAKEETNLIKKLLALKDNEILEIEYESSPMPIRKLVFKGIRGYWTHGISLTWNSSATMIAKYILGHYEEEDMFGGYYCPSKPISITKNRIPAKNWDEGGY